MADDGPGQRATSLPTLTARDLEILVAALRSPKSGTEFTIEIDYVKFAGLIGSANPGSARNSWAVLRKKLMASVPPTAAGPSTQAVGAGTKTKTPMKPKSTDPSKNASPASNVGSSADNNGVLAMHDTPDGISGASLETHVAAESGHTTGMNGTSTPITVEGETDSTAAQPVTSKGKGKEPASPDSEATTDAPAKKSAIEVTKKSGATAAGGPQTPGNDGMVADTAGAKAGLKIPGPVAGKKRGRKSNAQKAAEAAAATAAGDLEASDDEVEEKSAKKPRKTLVKKAAGKNDIATTDGDIADEADLTDGESTAYTTPAADGNAPATPATPTKKPAKPRTPRKPKDPNAPPSARSKAGKELKRQLDAAKVRLAAEEEAREDAEVEAEMAAFKAEKDKEVEEANAVLTGKKIMKKKIEIKDEGQDAEVANNTMSQVNANLNAAVSTTLADFEAAEARSEVSSAVSMTKAKGKGKAKAVEEEVDTSDWVPVGDESEAEEAD